MEFSKERELNDQIGGTLNTKESSTILKRKKVAGTPFEIITIENPDSPIADENFIVWGKFRLTKDDRTIEELETAIFERDYNFMIALSMAAALVGQKAEEQRIQNEFAIKHQASYEINTNGE